MAIKIRINCIKSCIRHHSISYLISSHIILICPCKPSLFYPSFLILLRIWLFSTYILFSFILIILLNCLPVLDLKWIIYIPISSTFLYKSIILFLLSFIWLIFILLPIFLIYVCNFLTFNMLLWTIFLFNIRLTFFLCISDEFIEICLSWIQHNIQIYFIYLTFYIYNEEKYIFFILIYPHL